MRMCIIRNADPKVKEEISEESILNNWVFNIGINSIVIPGCATTPPKNHVLRKNWMKKIY